MARKQASTSPGSPRVMAFLLGFRWLAMLLGLVLMWLNADTRLAPQAGFMSGLKPVVAGILLIYSAGASAIVVKLADQRVTLYILLVLDVSVGALLTLAYGSDFFLLAFALPVVEAAYYFGGFWAMLVGVLVSCIYIPTVLRQAILSTNDANWATPVSATLLLKLRTEVLAGYLLVAGVMAWVMSAIRGDEQDVEKLRREHKENQKILLEELSTTKKEFGDLFNQLDNANAEVIQTRSELEETRADLEGTLKKLHECRHQFQASQQLTQRKEQQLASTYKREQEELKKDLEDAQKTSDRLGSLLESAVTLNASLHRDQAVMNIIEALMKLVPSQTCLLYSLEIQDGVQELFPDGGASPYLEFLRNYSIKLGEGAVGWVAQHREAIRIDKETAEVEGEEVSTLFSYEKSALVAPLEHEGRLLGVIYLGRAAASSFSQEDFDLTVHFARLAGSVFNNALTYQRTLSVGIFDDVTGLYNALYFDERLTEEVKRGKRYQFPLSLILLDIDQFTRYNDVHGHADGNQVLKEVAAILREHTRETDVLARLENDEFAVLLVESEKSNAILIAERIRMALEMRYIGRAGPRKQIISVSGGIAAFPAEAQTREQLVERAADGLERARKKGGNQMGY